MKQILLTFLFLMACNCFAQDFSGYYHCSALDLDYEIGVISNNLIIQVPGKFKSDQVYFNIREKDIQDFYDAMLILRDKYLEWSNIAEDNNVTDLSKEFDISIPRITLSWYSNQWWFSFKHRITPSFRVTQEGDSFFTITGKGISTNNRYISQEYFFILNAHDFEEFLNIINPETFADKAMEKKKTDDLFK